MSMENVRGFFKAMAEDEELKKKLRVASVPAVQNAAVETLVQTAREAGYDFTAEELRAAFAAPAPQNDPGELNEDELEAVAGGLGRKTIPIEDIDWILHCITMAESFGIRQED